MGDYRAIRRWNLSFAGSFSARFEEIMEGLAGESRIFSVPTVIGRKPKLHVAGEAKVEKFPLVLMIEVS